MRHCDARACSFTACGAFEGTVSRTMHIIGRGVAFALNYAIDWSIATLIFHKPWTPRSYWL